MLARLSQLGAFTAKNFYQTRASTTKSSLNCLHRAFLSTNANSDAKNDETNPNNSEEAIKPTNVPQMNGSDYFKKLIRQKNENKNVEHEESWSSVKPLQEEDFEEIRIQKSKVFAENFMEKQHEYKRLSKEKHEQRLKEREENSKNNQEVNESVKEERLVFAGEEEKKMSRINQLKVDYAKKFSDRRTQPRKLTNEKDESDEQKSRNFTKPVTTTSPQYDYLSNNETKWLTRNRFEDEQIVDQKQHYRQRREVEKENDGKYADESKYRPPGVKLNGSSLFFFKFLSYTNEKFVS